MILSSGRKVYEVSPSGLTRWKDYIPVKYYTPSAANYDTWQDAGGITVDTIVSITGLTAWTDYIPVVTVADADSNHSRTNDAGFIRVIEI